MSVQLWRTKLEEELGTNGATTITWCALWAVRCAACSVSTMDVAASHTTRQQAAQFQWGQPALSNFLTVRLSWFYPISHWCETLPYLGSNVEFLWGHSDVWSPNSAQTTKYHWMFVSSLKWRPQGVCEISHSGEEGVRTQERTTRKHLQSPGLAVTRVEACNSFTTNTSSVRHHRNAPQLPRLAVRHYHLNLLSWHNMQWFINNLYRSHQNHISAQLSVEQLHFLLNKQDGGRVKSQASS